MHIQLSFKRPHPPLHTHTHTHTQQQSYTADYNAGVRQQLQARHHFTGFYIIVRSETISYGFAKSGATKISLGLVCFLNS